MSSLSSSNSNLCKLSYEDYNKQHLATIFEKIYYIPSYSRKFMWTEKFHITSFVKTCFEKHKAKNQHWIGYFLIYNDKNCDTLNIADAQHRVTIFILLCHAIGELSGNETLLQFIRSSMSSFGDDNPLLQKIPSDEDQRILDDNEWKRIPNLRSRYEEDFIALGNIMNNIPSDENTESLIPSAYAVILRIVKEQNFAYQEYISLLQFIRECIFFDKKVICDINFAIEIFQSINNIKVTVPPHYLLKNSFSRLIGIENSEVVHSFFINLEKSCPMKDADRFFQLLFNLTIKQLCWKEADYTSLITTINDYPTSDQDTKCLYEEFQSISARIFDVFKFMKENKFGKILNYISGGFELTWFFAIIGMHYSYNVLEQVFQIVIAYCLRIKRIPFTFNNATYRVNIMEKIVNYMFSELKTSQKLPDESEIINILQAEFVKLCSHKNLLNSSKVVVKFKESYSSKRELLIAKAALLFLTIDDEKEMILDQSKVDLEHVYPQNASKSESLSNTNLVHSLGNFTLFMSKNSSNGFVGNRGLGNKPFSVKVEHYRNSNIRMTQELAKFTKFEDEEILKRTEMLANQIEKLTSKHLNIN